MKSIGGIVLTLTAAATLSACSATPKRIESLELARNAMTQLAASPHTDIAAKQALNDSKRLVM
jgi:hypothetical protein